MTGLHPTSLPAPVPERCPGPEGESAGKASACAGCPNQSACASGAAKQAAGGLSADAAAVAKRLAPVRHVVLVLSGKGGVGKSTFSSQLAWALARADDSSRDVGLLDVDICGPSAPRMTALEREEIHQSADGWSPVYAADNLGVVSIGFMLPNPDEAVVWRGPRKNALITQFLRDVHWGELDYLVLDAPPGTSDEHISVAQLLAGARVDGAVILTTPQEVAVMDVRKELSFCKKVGVPVLGVVENMAPMRQPLERCAFVDADGADASERVRSALAAAGLGDVSMVADVFAANRGGGEAMAAATGVPFLGRVPLDPALGAAAEAGIAIGEHDPAAPAAKALEAIITKIVATLEKDASATEE